MTVLVDLEEFRALVRGADLGGFIVAALEERMQTTDRVIHNLISRRKVISSTVQPQTAIFLQWVP